MAQRAARRVKEGSSAILVPSGVDERLGWADSTECSDHRCNVQDFSCQTGKLLSNGDSENHAVGHFFLSSDICARRLNAREVTSHADERRSLSDLLFCGDGSVESAGEDHEDRTSDHSRRRFEHGNGTPQRTSRRSGRPRPGRTTKRAR